MAVRYFFMLLVVYVLSVAMLDLAHDMQTGNLVPSSNTTTPPAYSWRKEAIGFYVKYHYLFILSAVSYYPVIFGLQRLMRHREHGVDFKSGRVNYLFLWQAGLAVFSLLGSIHVLPHVFDTVYRHGGTQLVCKNNLHTVRDVGVWSLAFAVSKVVEFGDTIIIVLRKRQLRLIQYYHHLMTMVYCWVGLLYQGEQSNVIFVFGGMNYLVHTIMYTWYAVSALGYRSPRWIMMAVTLLQLAQMFLGVAATVTLSKCDGITDQPTQYNMLCFATFMYVGYVFLFGELFYSSYFGKKVKTSKKSKAS